MTCYESEIQQCFVDNSLQKPADTVLQRLHVHPSIEDAQFQVECVCVCVFAPLTFTYHHKPALSPLSFFSVSHPSLFSLSSLSLILFTSVSLFCLSHLSPLPLSL